LFGTRSIKNKLVTAITTAGLLAGLFGSAFVPVARADGAAAETSAVADVVCTGSNVDYMTAISSDAATCYVKASSAFSIQPATVATDGGSDILQLEANYSYSITASVAGVITAWVTPAVASAVTIANTSISVDGKTAAIGTGGARTIYTGAAGAAAVTAAANQALYIGTSLAMTGPAAGVSYTVTAKKLTGTTSTTLTTLTVTGVAAADLGAGKPTAYTSNAALQTTTRTLTDDITADSASTINGTASVNNLVDYFSVAYDPASDSDAGEYAVTYLIKDTYGIAVDITAKQFQATLTPSSCEGTIGVGSTVANADAAQATVSSVGVGASNGTIVVLVGHPGAAYPCKGTVTLTQVTSGLVIDTWDIGFIGETETLTLSGPSHVAAGLATSEDMEDQLVVVQKDAAGITIPGTFANPTFTAKDDDGVTLTITPTDTPDADVLGGGGTVGNAEEGGTENNNKFGFLAEGLCPALSEGEVRTIYASGETRAVAGTKATSNTISVTCTGKNAYVSAIAFGKTSYYPSESATVTFTMKDSAGRTAGVGSYMVRTGYAISNSPTTGGSATTEPAAVIDSLDANDDAGSDDEKGIVVKTAGTYEWTYVMGSAAGVAGFLFDITDNDGATAGNQQGLFAIRTVVTGAFGTVSDATLTAGPKKLVATATFGAAAGKKVAFVLESASGVTKTYYRKANASGVAKYTLALRGTWTVYATYGDEITDTVTLRK
jgi:hypothetical protein